MRVCNSASLRATPSSSTAWARYEIAPSKMSVRASGLNLVTAAITLWNTVYLERAVEALGQTQVIGPALLQHVSPLGWEHINLTGDYTWSPNKRIAMGGFRPLRRPRAHSKSLA